MVMGWGATVTAMCFAIAPVDFVAGRRALGLPGLDSDASARTSPDRSAGEASAGHAVGRAAGASLLDRAHVQGQAGFPSRHVASAGWHAATLLSRGGPHGAATPSSSGLGGPRARPAALGAVEGNAGAMRRWGPLMAVSSTALRYSDEDEDDEFREAWQGGFRQEAQHVVVESGREDKEDFTLPVPSDWALAFRGPLRLIANGAGEQIYGLDLTSDAGVAVELTTKDARSPHARRELAAIRRLVSFCDLGACQGGHVAMPLETCVLGSVAYQLAEGHGEYLVDQLAASQFSDILAIWERTSGGETFSEALQSPMTAEEGLLILVDILRGLHDLELAGLLHGSLTPEAIFCVNGRATVAGLGRVCSMHDVDADLRCGGLREAGDLVYISAFWHAPEMVGGAPTGPENHVWSAGLILCEMLFGYNPVEDAVLRHEPGVSLYDTDAEAIRELVRQRWTRIELEEPFALLEPDMQGLLSDMLSRDTSLRPSTAEVLARAAKMVEARGIRVPAARARPRLPGGRASTPSTLRSAGEARQAIDEGEDSWQ
mmetsp:Transcript_1952/g.5899  ORF Transcript_1952/g.5899 Transcript_1952/m.5899 type:complete len:544 (+) Transcript_1952:90-1721(+)